MHLIYNVNKRHEAMYNIRHRPTDPAPWLGRVGKKRIMWLTLNSLAHLILYMHIVFFNNHMN